MNKRNFTKLTPINDAQLNVYEDALDFALHDSDVKNIAISGSYGSGKSSILESYKSIHDKFNFLHISLAHFGKKTDDPEQIKIQEHQLEGRILNQIVQQIEKNKIPKSQFSAKNKANDSTTKMDTMMLCLLSFAIIFMSKFDSASAVISSMEKSDLSNIMNEIFSGHFYIVSLLLGTISIIYFINRIVTL